MIIYFHLAKNKEKKGEKKAAVPWVSNWNREQLVSRIRAEIDDHMGIVKMAEIKKKLKEMKEKEKKEEKKKNQVLPLRMIRQRLMLMFPLSLSRKKTQKNLQGNNPKGDQKNGIQKEEANFRGFQFKEHKTQPRKRKHVIEDSSSEEENHSYDGMPEVSVATETDPLFQGQTEQSSVNKPSDSIFSREEESLSDPAQQQIIVFRLSSQPLDIVLIQLYLPSSQTTSESPVPPFEPSPPTERDPAPEASAVALLMMARTASYVPKELPLPSFSLGLTDSSQEETQTQEGVAQAEAQVVKSPETTILIEELDVLVEKIAKSGEKKTPDFPEGKTLPTEKQTVGQTFDKFETPVRRNLMSAEMKEKCYLWTTRIRTYANDSTDEYDSICTLNAQQPLVLSRVHFASLKDTSYIEVDIVTAMCLILNQQNIKRFEEEIYCLPPNIVNMAIGNHPNGEFLQPKSKKPFNVEDYPMFIPFLDRKKLASHPYIFALVCYSNHWWIWWLIKSPKHENNIVVNISPNEI
ncbi:hypothetical protein Ahy_B02g058068 isoform E [Arachis hypogaea]|uniref:Ubiquitin-like protease family profile domain-containing protein n=1 Tax=Arachis hypogaea TaxID=3818 RepID=A0A445ADR4_ARAHY|nr:hypothetical protein Ahy_B02g058068 isoform E [Arachis hypogaea]